MKSASQALTTPEEEPTPDWSGASRVAAWSLFVAGILTLGLFVVARIDEMLPRGPEFRLGAELAKSSMRSVLTGLAGAVALCWIAFRPITVKGILRMWIPSTFAALLFSVTKWPAPFWVCAVAVVATLIVGLLAFHVLDRWFGVRSWYRPRIKEPKTL